MVKPTITPWRSQADLLLVREQIYSTSLDDRQRAVSRVMAWKLRGNLPHAVESTALLVDAIMHHSMNSTNSIFSIRAVYSAAFTRFVTGFCDIGRHKERSLEPSSMLDIAKQIGMPLEFVALRHEATHEELPAIQRLVKAAEDGLAWLWNVYWSRIDESESEESVKKSLPEVKSRAKEIFRTIRGLRREALKSRKPKDQTEEMKMISKNLLRLMDGKRLRIRAVTDVLVEDQLLIPSKRVLGAPLDGAYLIWDGLLRDVIATSGAFLTALQQSMLSALVEHEGPDSANDVNGEALCQWLLHMIDYATSPKQQNAFMGAIVAASCLHSSYWLDWLAKRTLDISDAEFKGDWEDLVEASRSEQAAAGSLQDVVMEDGGIVEGIVTVGPASGDSGIDNVPWRLQPAAPVGLPIGVIQ